MNEWSYALCSVRHAGPPVLKSGWFVTLGQLERNTPAEDRETWTVIRRGGGYKTPVYQIGIDNHWVRIHFVGSPKDEKTNRPPDLEIPNSTASPDKGVADQEIQNSPASGEEERPGWVRDVVGDHLWAAKRSIEQAQEAQVSLESEECIRQRVVEHVSSALVSLA